MGYLKGVGAVFGFALIIGAVGASDHDSITMSRFILQSLIGIAILVICISGYTYKRSQ